MWPSVSSRPCRSFGDRRLAAGDRCERNGNGQCSRSRTCRSRSATGKSSTASTSRSRSKAAWGRRHADPRRGGGDGGRLARRSLRREPRPRARGPGRAQRNGARGAGRSSDGGGEAKRPIDIGAVSGSLARAGANHDQVRRQSGFEGAPHGLEFVWVRPFEQQDSRYVGKLRNEPQSVKDLKAGDAIAFDEKDIVDWTYFDDGKMKGNFTACALLKRRPQEEMQAFKKAYGLDCEP